MSALALTGCATGRYDTTGLKALPAPSVEPISRPASGGVVSAFGARVRGVLSKGVWIEAAPGSSVLASANGRVAVAEERFEGYGKTVIVEHPNRLWTVYAHLGTILVKPGDSVMRGQAIAMPDAPTRRFYFEFRRGDRAEDPARIWV